MAFLTSPKARKFYILALYALFGAAIQAELVPAAWIDALRDYALPALFGALGLGHVLPEAGKKS
jgi:hypothetical protein